MGDILYVDEKGRGKKTRDRLAGWCTYRQVSRAEQHGLVFVGPLPRGRIVVLGKMRRGGMMWIDVDGCGCNNG